jgi:hypothetical protein
MAEDSLGFYVKAMMIRRTAHVFSTNVPSRRELFIQIDKLEKLTNKFDKKFTVELVLSTPREKYRHKKASDLHRLTLQSKLVDELFSRMIEELLQRVYPNAIPVRRKSFKERGRQFTAGVNKLIQQDVKRLRAEAKANVLKEFSPSELSNGKG